MHGRKTATWMVLFTAVTLFSAASLSAQGLAIGFKLGPTFSTLDVSDDDAEQGRLTGFGGGGFVRFSLGGLSLQPEILFLTKGSEFDETGVEDGKLKINYIEIPVFLHFSLGQGNIAPYLLVGPTFGFDAGCEVSAEVGGTEFEADCDDDSQNFDIRRKDLDVGGAAALGIAVGAGPGSLLLEGRYTHGFTDIADDQPAAGDTNSEVRNRSFALFIGYSIGLGSR